MFFPLLTRRDRAPATERVPEKERCWADSAPNYMCSQRGTGRLGLCEEHELAILGAPTG